MKNDERLLSGSFVIDIDAIVGAVEIEEIYYRMSLKE